jgi:hypothetical protein
MARGSADVEGRARWVGMADAFEASAEAVEASLEDLAAIHNEREWRRANRARKERERAAGAPPRR